MSSPTASGGLPAADLLGPGGRTIWLIVAATVVLAVAAWVPLVSEYPQSWDEVQYILGVREYSVEKHQPHPPGYYLHMNAAAGLSRTGLDDRTSLIVLSVLAGIALVAVVVGWAAELGGACTAAIAGALVVTSPLIATAATEGRTYATGALGAAVVGYLSWRLLNGDRRAAALSAVAIGVTAGFRPTVALFIAPLWLWAIFSGNRRHAIFWLAVAAATTAAWAIPFIYEVGGVARYLSASSPLGGMVEEISPARGAPIRFLGRNLVRIGSGLFLLLGIGWLGVPGGIKSSSSRLGYVMLLWTAPALLFFTLMHTGTPLYAMILAAPLVVLASVGIERGVRGGTGFNRRIAVIAALLVTQGAMLYLFVIMKRDNTDEACRTVADALAPLSDDRTVMLAVPKGVPFRHAGYLLPEAHIYDIRLGNADEAGKFPNYMHRMSSGIVTPPVLHENVSRLLLPGNSLSEMVPDGRIVEKVPGDGTLDVWAMPVAENERLRIAADGSVEILGGVADTDG